MATKALKILKFGGTSMGSAEAMQQVISIVRKPQRDARVAAVVVSAMSGVTDSLIKIARLAATQDNSYKQLLAELEKRHLRTVHALVRRKRRAEAEKTVKALLGYLKEIVTGIWLVRELSPGALDYIMSYGERLSAHILTHAMRDKGIAVEYLNARTVVKTDANFGEAAVDFAATNRAIKRHFASHRKLQIVTGFIGSTADNKTTTLGRGGSDYTASIFGAALDVQRIEIWTDVSGVYTADPRKVPEARPIAVMSYREAVEMSYFGAKVIHPPTMRPAELKRIPIVIKNTFEPAAPGTIIGPKSERNGAIAKGISSVGGIAMFQVEGVGMLHTKGAAGRIFAALARVRVGVLLITQASSQNSISFAVYERHVERARAAIEEEFAAERARNLIAIGLERDLSIIAVVGEGMHHMPGVAARVFSTLGKNGVNIVAIAQGSSELNISVVVSKADETRALRAIHTSFFFPALKPINIFLVGAGLIGSTLLRQIANQREYLRNAYGFAIKIAGIGNSKGMLFVDEGIDPANWKNAMTRSRSRMSLKKFVEMVTASSLPSKVFVDCTASDEVARTYADLLRHHVSVVTPNKRANSGPYAYYQELAELSKRPGVSFLYETNACAALPIISMIDDLVLSGDRIRRIEGVLSGTMSYIFNAFAKSKSFSESVAEAKKLGFTEPDPRQDLNGMDVARKILILARKSGYPLELKDVKLESLLSPAAARAKSVDEFFKRLQKEDATWERRKRAAEKKGQRLRYIATLEKGKVRVGVRAVALPHPFFELEGSDNIVTIATDRYSAESPLLIQGPGAGGEVTAAGVFADILRVARDAA